METKVSIVSHWELTNFKDIAAKWNWFVFYHCELVIVLYFFIRRWFQKGSTNLSCNKIRRHEVRKPLPKELFAKSGRQASHFKWYLGKFPLTPMPVEGNWKWKQLVGQQFYANLKVGRNLFCFSFAVCCLSKKLTL